MVRLRPAPPQGLSALVWLPDSVIERTGRVGAGTSGWSAQPVGARARAVAGESVALAPGGHASLSGGFGGSGGSGGFGGSSGSGGQATLTGPRPSSGGGYSDGNGNGHSNSNPALEGRTASGWFRGGQDGNGRPAAGTLGGQDGGFSPDWSPGADPAAPFGGDPAAAFGEPTHTEQTSAGLPVRVPRANMPTGAGGGGGGPSDGQTTPLRAGGIGRAPGKGAGSPKGGHALPRRSPDQARSRLAGFQRGTRRAEGQGGGGQSPRAGEGTLS
jgi:hypothetical protein